MWSNRRLGNSAKPQYDMPKVFVFRLLPLTAIALALFSPLGRAQTTSAFSTNARVLEASSRISLIDTFTCSPVEMADSLETARSAGPPGNLAPDVILNNLSIGLRLDGKYAKAEQLLRCSIVLRRQSVGPDDRSFASMLGNFGAGYVAERRFAEAEVLYEAALSLDAASSYYMDRLADVYRSERKYNEAEAMYKRSLVLCEGVSLIDPCQETTLRNLAQVYFEQRQYAKAEPLLQRALVVAEFPFGAESASVTTSVNDLANLYRVERRYAEAVPLYERTIAILGEVAYASKSFNLAVALNGLGLTFGEQGKYEEAERLFERSLAILETVKGKDSSDVAASLRNLASVYRRTGRSEQAQSLEDRAVRIKAIH
jgi:tetratricopeptide (TPR) repeat protein